MVDYIEVKMATVDGNSEVVLLSNTINLYAVISFTIERAVNTPSHVLKMKCSTSGLKAASTQAGFALPQVKQGLRITYYTGGVGTVEFDGFVTNIENDVIFTTIEAMGNGLYMANAAMSHEVTTAQTTRQIAKALIDMIDVNADDTLTAIDLATSNITVGASVVEGRRKYKADTQVCADLLQNLSLMSAANGQPMWVFVQSPNDRAIINLVDRGSGHDGAHSTALAVSHSTGIIGSIKVTAESFDDLFNDITVKTATGEYNTTFHTPSATVASRSLYGVRSKLLSAQEMYDNVGGSGQALAEGIMSFSLTPATILKFKCKHSALIGNGEYIVNQRYNVTDNMTGKVYNNMVCVAVKHSWPYYTDEIEVVSQGLGEITFSEADSEFTYRVEQLEQYTANRNVMAMAKAEDYYFKTDQFGVVIAPDGARVGTTAMYVPFKNVQYDYGQGMVYQENEPWANMGLTEYIAPVSGLYHIELLIEIEDYPTEPVAISNSNGSYTTVDYFSRGVLVVEHRGYGVGGGGAENVAVVEYVPEAINGRTAREFSYSGNVMLEETDQILIYIVLQNADGVKR